MSCRFAGVGSPSAFWDSIMSRSANLGVPGPEAELPVGERSVFNRPYPARIGQLGDLYSCVQAMQNFPRQINAGENQDLYFATQLAFDALADAAMKPHSREAVNGSVRIGYAPPFNASTINWLQHTSFLDQTMDILRRFMPSATDANIDAVRVKLAESLPAPNAASFLLGAGYRFASWIARECNFNGPATIMDAGMLTGATVLMDAKSDLDEGRVDIALAGSLTPPVSRSYLEGLSGEVPFSVGQEYQPFSEDAAGTLPGEGGAFFVLKRRADALRDRDRIYAVIRSVAVGHNPPGDPSVILSRATEKAGVPVSTIGLIEADGNGVKAAECREIGAIQKLWGEHRPGGPLVGVGSVKGNIGHTLRASMAAGVAKAALALSRRVLPPQVDVTKPNYMISNLASSVYLLTEARPWISGDSSSPRRAVVMGSNFDAVDPVGGAAPEGRCAAIVLEEEPEDRQ